MTNRQKRALYYAALFVLVAMEWPMIVAALFLCLMDFIDSADQRNWND